MAETTIALTVPPEALKGIIREVLAEVDQARAAVPERRLAYSEAEAAALLGLAPHQLRDERLRGKIASSQIVGRRVRYLRGDLVAYLMARRSKTKAT
jgi:hypothetical protein